MTQKKRTFKVGTLLFVAVLAGAGYYGYQFYAKSGAPKPVMQMPAPVVDAIVVAEKQVLPKTSFVAKIESKDKVGLRARVQGFLQERLFEEGDIVKKGDPLFVIEQVNFKANVKQAEALVAKAKADLTNANAVYNRNKTLYRTKDVSKARLDETKAAYLTAEALLKQASAALEVAQKDLEYTTITAPIDGKIGEYTYSVGELIGPSSNVLAEIVTIDPMDAVFSISENQLLLLQKSFNMNEAIDAQFITANGTVYPHKGQINFVDVKLDEQMNTLKIKATFDNPDNQLIAGQFGRIELNSATPQSEIVIPLKAVQQDMIGSFVYIIDENNKIIRRDITRGQAFDDFTLVVDLGLKAGEKIVVNGFQRIMPDVTVNPQFAD